MSCSYADGLSSYRNKGKCGLPEKFDKDEVVDKKVQQLLEWIKMAKHVVVHTGAGISTAAGIPDFRGPSGVWTLEKKGEKPVFNKTFDDARPTVTHMSLKALFKANLIHAIVSQNVDGLHLKSGFPRSSLYELHGNVFIQQCSQCERQLISGCATPTVGQKCLNIPCPFKKPNDRVCRGRLHDTVLDWEDNLPENDLLFAEENSRKADLSIVLGSTLQIVPSGNLPLTTKKNRGKLVICNLQPTKHDSCADLIIHSYVDKVLSLLCKHLGVNVPEYTENDDPTVLARNGNCSVNLLEWTLSNDIKTKRPDSNSKEKCKRLKRNEQTAEDTKVTPRNRFESEVPEHIITPLTQEQHEIDIKLKNEI